MPKKIYLKNLLFLILILVLSSFLRFYKITTIFPFNGDVAWDFLSAESFLKGGPLPLIGIASSVPWLHQGTFFTYILIVILGLFKGNLIAPAFFTATLGILMQFELSNLVLLPVILTCFWWKRKDIPVMNIILLIISFTVPWLPKIIYDFSHGFTQTLGYFAWVGHKMIPVVA